jgi:hypothetical protein
MKERARRAISILGDDPAGGEDAVGKTGLAAKYV